MAVGSRLRREIRGINRHMRRESYRWGQQIEWFVFDHSSVADESDRDLYDEGGLQSRPGTTDTGTTRHWFAPKKVQAYSARVDEGAEDYDETGSYTVDRFYCVVNAQLLRNFGIDPDSTDHLDDRIRFNGRIFQVEAMEKHGWVADVYTQITVRATQVMGDERQTDDVSWYG